MNLRLAVWACSIACTVIAVNPAQRAHAQCQYELTVIQAGPPNCDPYPPSPTHGSGINESTQVVGSYVVCAIGGDEAFLWDGGPEVIALGRPPGVGRAWAGDINDAGLIVGTMACTGMGDRAFLHDGAQFIEHSSGPFKDRIIIVKQQSGTHLISSGSFCTRLSF